MKQQYTFYSKANKSCCNEEEKVYTDAEELLDDKIHDHNNHGHHHDLTDQSLFQMFLPSGISLILLLAALGFDHWLNQDWFSGIIRFTWYLVAFVIVGFPVLKDAVKSIIAGEIFSEFLLMSIATVGAFAIGEYPEGVAVMLFYSVGEVFQSMAVSRAKSNIKTLLDQRPDEVTIIENNQPKIIKAKSAEIGQIIQLKSGEKLALDGELHSEQATFNTAALTGESKPDSKKKGEPVLAGMINLNKVAQIKITAAYQDSKLSKILQLVQDATSQKAPTELFIRKFAKIYTPIVVFLALGICLIPYFFTANYIFSEWLYKALIFLVISCPCALVISIPLGYFGGISAASRHGILFKGGNFLDLMATIKNVVMDKTGTMTEGVFKVQEVSFLPEFNQKEILNLVNALESLSSHPIATAIQEFVGEVDSTLEIENTEEMPGMGLKATVDGKDLLVGNFKLMDHCNIKYHIDPKSIFDTTIAVSFDRKFVGYLTIADKIKEDAQQTIQLLHKMNIKVTMLSGDKDTVVKHVANELGIDEALGDLLPEDKVNKVTEIKSQYGTVTFVGDGINDAPVVALSDVGIAMGGLGSDATIETADIIIQDDKPSKIPMAINIGKQTKKIVWQNIALAFGVKGAVLILGAGGLATMWEAVFADVGVALIAILNAVRIQKMKF